MLDHLELHNFRNHEHLVLGSLAEKYVCISGRNGSGKSSILEAISCLIPGRGMRSSRLSEMINHRSDSWVIHACYASEPGFQVGLSYSEDKKFITNGVDASNQNELLRYIRINWLTTSSYGVIAESSEIRRRFLDRICYSFFMDHASLLVKYGKLLKERSNLLANNVDELLLATVEKHIAKFAHAIILNRMNTLKLLLEGVIDDIILPKIEISGLCEDIFTQDSGTYVENFMSEIKRARHHDEKRGGCSVGPHRSKIVFLYCDQDGRMYSTGEQKYMVISMILAQMNVLSHKYGIPSIILLDDIMTYLDSERRRRVFNILENLDLQAWFTTTEADIISQKGVDMKIIQLGE